MFVSYASYADTFTTYLCVFVCVRFKLPVLQFVEAATSGEGF